MIELSVVSPVYNEADCLELFASELTDVLKDMQIEWEWICVNDGSSDNTLEIARKLKQSIPQMKIINLSRNFGHQIAVKAGVDHVEGRACVIIDADLQDPPKIIAEFYAKMKTGGYDVVYAVRNERAGESWFKKFTANLFYRLIQKITDVSMPLDTGDFRIISARVIKILQSLKESRPYLRGLISWMGFKQTGIVINRDARIAGKTKYSLNKMLKLAWNGIAHFSTWPLHMCTALGLLISTISTVWMAHALYVRFVLRVTVPGWTSILIAVLLLGSVQLITLGIIGSYLGRVYDEVRRRPLYLIQDIEGCDDKSIS
ncbi:MAG: glycosyltransferase involved in cell wall biosynthesis [Candidatus Omnitrophota bacterium]|jgi:glycosyltransferase involved in cell wall biosynthesis